MAGAGADAGAGTGATDAKAKIHASDRGVERGVIKTNRNLWQDDIDLQHEIIFDSLERVQ